jgi:Fe2+ or Zn2+ uptake regulation protein
MSDALQQLKQSLMHANLKVTPARLAVLEVLLSASKPLSPESIANQIKDVDKATVYRNLQTLKDAGILRQVNLEHDHTHYELANDDHHHLVCRKCGKVEDFSGCFSEEIIKQALKQSNHFSSVQDHSIELFGICDSCSS